MSHKFPYKWYLADDYPTKGIEYHGTTVMTTFACGGGSTMGYKLAGYDVVAANDIDPQMAKVYKANHNPKQFFLCGIKELLERDDLPQVDVLDGSPPCSLFSTTGIREEGWQREKMFREGQAKQILDDLFFDFIDLAEKMQPKIVIAENVKGMIIGNAKWYTREVVRRFSKIGYTCQVFLFNAATMGVPQARERVFFIAHRSKGKIGMKFNEDIITYSKIEESKGKALTPGTLYLERWLKRRKSDLDYADIIARDEPDRRSNFSVKLIHKHRIPPTIVSGSDFIKYHKPEVLSDHELCQIGTFPVDYKFTGANAKYLIGMSVPPVMMAQVAHQVYEQLIKNNNGTPAV